MVKEETKMKQLPIVGCIFVCVFGFTVSVLAFQEVVAIVTSSHIDHNRQTCTITIDRRHYKTSQTAKCRDRNFSWRCLPGDYRFELAEQSKNNNHPIKIRFSEYGCDNITGNMLLLTVW
jgi:hypothetical protein